ncbi:MAG: SgcJ/EcaC family oxidoreductase [Steroidobacteraceae bacterium]
MITLKNALILAVSLIVLAGTASAADTATDTAAIRAVNPAWAKAYNAGDAAAVAALYAEDAVVYPPGAPAARGHTAIREHFVKDIKATKAAGGVINLSTGDVAVSGDLAWESGTFKVTDKSGATVDTGKYVSVFQKRNGKWLLFRDIWNSDAPSATPAPAASAKAPTS